MKKINKILNNNYIFYAIIAILIALSIYTIMPLPNMISEYSGLIELDEKKLKEKQELESQLSVVNEEELRLDIARSKYKISNDGEILFVFPQEEDKTDESQD